VECLVRDIVAGRGVDDVSAIEEDVALLARVDTGDAFDALLVFGLHPPKERGRVPAAVWFVVDLLVALVTDKHEVVHTVAVTR
jgi:hypothetical protein